jgi:hypothetical protein
VELQATPTLAVDPLVRAPLAHGVDRSALRTFKLKTSALFAAAEHDLGAVSACRGEAVATHHCGDRWQVGRAAGYGVQDGVGFANSHVPP